MAFTVEDGTGLEESNSPATVAEADTYFAERGNLVWLALNTAQKQANLILASDYMEIRFGARVIGNKIFEEQALSWPRENTGFDSLDYDEDTEEGPIPVNWKKACFEYAVRVSANPLAPDPAVDASGVSMVTTMQKAGPVEQRFATASGSSNAAAINILRPYPGADMYLRDLLNPTSTRTYR
jgi:hypothetical protein